MDARQPGGAARPSRPRGPLALAAGAAAVVRLALALPWATGEATTEWFGTSTRPTRDYAGFDLNVGTLAGGLALAAVGALLAAPRGRLPVAFAALAFAGAALAALLPFLGVEVCTSGFLSSACLGRPEPRLGAGAAAAVSLLSAGLLAASSREGGKP